MSKSKKDKNEVVETTVQTEEQENEVEEGVERMFDTIEEAEKNKPTDPKKAKWKLIGMDGYQNGKPITKYGWSGGAAVLGWQAACKFGGWRAYTVHGKKGGALNVHAQLAQMSPEARKELLEQYKADLMGDDGKKGAGKKETTKS